MSDPVFEDSEIFCSLKRSKPVVLYLRLRTAAKGRLVSGFAASCDCKVGCLKDVQCLLGKNHCWEKTEMTGFISSSKDCDCSVRKEKLAAEQT